MTPGSRTRRTVPGFAALTMAATLAGCQQTPFARMAPSPNRPQSALATAGRATLLPATVALDVPSEMSSIEPSPTARPGSLEPSAGRPIDGPPVAAEPLPPTPLLDAAFVKAQGLTDALAGEMARPTTPTTGPTARDKVQEPAPSSTPVLGPGGPVAVALVSNPNPAPAPALAPRPPAEPSRPEDVWREGVDRLAGLARAKLDQGGGAEGPWGLRSRVLAWLAEPGAGPDLPPREPDPVRSVLRALDDAPAPPHARGDEVRAAVQALEGKAPLELVDLRLCSKVERFGDFKPIEPAACKAGHPVVIYCEVDGLRHEETTSGYRTYLATKVEILPDGGGPPAKAWAFDPAEEHCRRRRRDYYLAIRLILPGTLAPGDYKLRLTEKDLIGDRSASREVAFAVARD